MQWLVLGHGGFHRSNSAASQECLLILWCYRAATLLQSSGIAFRYGVSGPFWYASGATVQILLFATLAIELKRKAPNAHTFLVSPTS